MLASRPVTDMSNACAAVIPAFDEVGTVGALVERARAQVARVFVVDDGSKDGTAQTARDAGAEVLRHGTNLGKGAALRAGLQSAWRAGFEWAVTLDADGQHAPEEIPRFRSRAAATGCALVVGNRMHDAARMPGLRRVVNRWMSRHLSRRAGQELPDSQCGFRLLRLEAWARLPLRADHFEVESESLLAFLAAGYRVEFVPVAVLPARRPSRIRAVRDSVRWLRWCARGRVEGAIAPSAREPLITSS